MKKFICLLLVLVTFVSALCSCGNGENNAEEKAEISVLPEVAKEWELDSDWQNDLTQALSKLKKEHEELKENGEYIEFCKSTYEYLNPLFGEQFDEKREKLEYYSDHFDEYTGIYEDELELLGILAQTNISQNLMFLAPKFLTEDVNAQSKYETALMQINGAAEVFCGIDEFLTKIKSIAPLGLQFGMTSDEASKCLSGYLMSIDGLSEVDEGKHYVANTVLGGMDHDNYYGSKVSEAEGAELSAYYENMTTTNIMLVFNSSKKLCSYDVYVEMKNTPNIATYLFNHYVEFYEELLGVESSDYVEGNQAKAVIEKDNIEVSVYWEVNGTEMEVSAIVIDKNFY